MVVPITGQDSGLIKEGDLLIRVDDFDVRGKQLKDVAKFTLGIEGSKANLMLMRGQSFAMSIFLLFTLQISKTRRSSSPRTRPSCSRYCKPAAPAHVTTSAGLQSQPHLHQYTTGRFTVAILMGDNGPELVWDQHLSPCPSDPAWPLQDHPP
jgi:hypothetical protein